MVVEGMWKREGEGKRGGERGRRGCEIEDVDRVGGELICCCVQKGVKSQC